MRVGTAEGSVDICQLNRQQSLELTDSRLFRKALWGIAFAPTPSGTEITCTIDLVTKRRYFFVVQMLWANKRAIQTDLGFLKEIIENDQGPQEFEQSTT